jgi:hypothetical protein
MDHHQALSESHFELGILKNKQSRFRVILILFLISLPFDLNLIWSFTGIGWLYWLSWLLLEMEKIIGGILLILFPSALQRLFSNKADLRVSVLLGMSGIYFCTTSFEGLYFLLHRWSVECINIAECLR